MKYTSLLACVVALCGLSAGCVSPFTEYYRPYRVTAPSPVAAAAPVLREIPPSVTLTQATADAVAEGYEATGYSSFNGCGNWGPDAVLAQARLLGSSLVVWRKVPTSRKGRYDYHAVYFAPRR